MKPTRETLRDLYQTQGLSCQAIGDRLGWSAAFIHNRLQGFGIATRPPGTNQRAAPEKPTASELRSLYVDQQLSTRQIGAMYGVKHISVRRWLQRESITARAVGRGLANRGIEPPTSDELYRMVHLEHKSYAEIAAVYGVDFTAIPHWLSKHGIEKPEIWTTRSNGRWNRPDADTLWDLYIRQHLSTLQIADSYGVTSGGARGWLKYHNIERRPSGWDGKRFDCIDGHVVRSTYERRVDNWLSLHHVPHEYEPDLPFDKRFKADFLANGYYIEIWGVNAAAYNKRKRRKKRLYKEHGLPLIEISPACFAEATKDRWARKLTKCLTSPAAVSPAQSELPLRP